MKHIAAAILLITIMTGIAAAAVPAVPVISLVGNNNATFTSSGGGTCWFRWGLNDEIPEWKTPNVSAAGPWTQRVYGSPYLPVRDYYVMACNESGCSVAATFTSTAVTPIPQPTYGRTYDNITESGFDISILLTQSMTPLIWVFPGSLASMGIALVSGLILGFYFLGLWLRQRTSKVAVIIGLIFLGFFIMPNSGMGWGMPAEFVAIAQLLVYAIIAGLIMSLLKKG